MINRLEIVKSLKEMKEYNSNLKEFDKLNFNISFSWAQTNGLDWWEIQDITVGLNFRLSGRGSSHLRYTIDSLLRKYNV